MYLGADSDWFRKDIRPAPLSNSITPPGGSFVISSLRPGCLLHPRPRGRFPDRAPRARMKMSASRVHKVPPRQSHQRPPLGQAREWLKWMMVCRRFAG